MQNYRKLTDNILLVGDKEIDFNHNILKILDFDEVIVVDIQSDFEKDGHIDAAKQPLNNIYAINSKGDIVWNIKDLVLADKDYTGTCKDGLYGIINNDKDCIVVSEFSGGIVTIDVRLGKIIDRSFSRF